MKDLVHNIKALLAFTTANTTATGNGAIIDRAGFYSFTWLYHASAAAAVSTSNYFTVVFQEGDLANGSDMADITDTKRYLYADETNPSAKMDALAAGSTFKLGLALGTKRYVRVRLVETGTADMTGVGLALLGHATHSPVA